MKCPRCHRDTYSVKWKSCTGCDPVQDVSRETLVKPVTSETTWERIIRRFVTERANA